jgi:hypothetical protein
LYRCSYSLRSAHYLDLLCLYLELHCTAQTIYIMNKQQDAGSKLTSHMLARCPCSRCFVEWTLSWPKKRFRTSSLFRVLFCINVSVYPCSPAGSNTSVVAVPYSILNTGASEQRSHKKRYSAGSIFRWLHLYPSHCNTRSV